MTLTEHAKGYVDSRLRLIPPVFATEDYINGYRMGLFDRLYEARMAIDNLKYAPGLTPSDEFDDYKEENHHDHCPLQSIQS